MLDKTVTAMGGRLLRSWLEQPLLNREMIEARHDAVGELADQPILAASIREEMEGVYKGQVKLTASHGTATNWLDAH